MSWRIHEPRKMTVLGLAVMKTPFIQTARGPVLKGTGRAARLNHKTTNKPMAYYIEMIPLNSSFIRAAGHDGNTLYVEFHTGGNLRKLLFGIGLRVMVQFLVWRFSWWLLLSVFI